VSRLIKFAGRLPTPRHALVPGKFQRAIVSVCVNCWDFVACRQFQYSIAIGRVTGEKCVVADNERTNSSLDKGREGRLEIETPYFQNNEEAPRWGVRIIRNPRC
jgi:hypothetical protein